MVGIILVGHGHFASGMKSALQLLAGDCEGLSCIDFLEGTSFEDLCIEVNTEIAHFKDERVIVLTDLPSGSPCKASALATYYNKNVRAISGVNFPIVLELALAKDYCDDIDELLETSIKNAQDSLMKVVLEV